MEPINETNYRQFPAVSNSDLGQLDKYWNSAQKNMDLTVAYANGTLIDCMITEPHRVDYFKYTIEGEPYSYSKDEFDRAKEMKKSFYKDEFCANFVKNCKFQHITYNPAFKITYEDLNFTLPAKCKWDLFRTDIDLSGDIKSTTATTQKQVEDCIRYFDYDRSRAWYMDLEGRNNDILIFISKVNFKVFKVPITRNSEIYKEGKKKYQDIAFREWYLFGDVWQNDKL